LRHCGLRLECDGLPSGPCDKTRDHGACLQRGRVGRARATSAVLTSWRRRVSAGLGAGDTGKLHIEQPRVPPVCCHLQRFPPWIPAAITCNSTLDLLEQSQEKKELSSLYLSKSCTFGLHMSGPGRCCVSQPQATLNFGSGLTTARTKRARLTKPHLQAAHLTARSAIESHSRPYTDSDDLPIP